MEGFKIPLSWMWEARPVILTSALQALTLLSAGLASYQAWPVLLSICWLSPISFSFQKFRVDMPGSGSAFIPTINAITTSQDLQWMVQPVITCQPLPRSHPYSPCQAWPLSPGTWPSRDQCDQDHWHTVGRRRRDEQVQFCLGATSVAL